MFEIQEKIWKEGQITYTSDRRNEVSNLKFYIKVIRKDESGRQDNLIILREFICNFKLYGWYIS